MRRMVVVAQTLIVGRVDVSGSLGSKKHLYAYYYEDRCHGYKARHGRVALIPDIWQAWVGQGLEGGWEEMDEGGRNQDTCAEMSRDEEELVGDGNPWEPFNHYRETARCSGQSCSQAVLMMLLQTTTRSQGKHTCSTQSEYENQGEHMERCIVCSFATFGSTCRSLVLLPSE
jgi:hypothetical protein